MVSVKPSVFKVKANAGVAYRSILLGADLNSNSSFLVNFLGVNLWEISHKYRQDAVCTDHEIYAFSSFGRIANFSRIVDCYDGTAGV